MRLGIQLYTLRDDLDRDLEGTLAAVSAAGIRWVETAGFHGRTARQFADALARHGLAAISAHVMPPLDLSTVDEVLSDAQTLGYSRVVWPWIGEEWRADGVRFGAALKPLGDKLAAAGLRLAYHNHDFEFSGSAEGETFLGALFEAAPWLNAQLDVYWAAYAGQDPVLWIRSLRGRIPTVHLKDGRLGGSPEFLPAGEGDLDWAPVLAACREAGVEAGIIELDSYAGSVIEAVQRSAAFFQSQGLD